MSQKTKTNSVDAALSKARGATASLHKAKANVDAQKSDYRAIPGFSKYEVNSRGIVRSVKTKQMQSKKSNKKYQLFNDKGERPTLTLDEINALFPAPGQEKADRQTEKKERKPRIKKDRVELTAEDVKGYAERADIKAILEIKGPKHTRQYKLHLLGIDTDVIMALTDAPYNATKRNIWLYTSGKKKVNDSQPTGE
jgi:hypothetical protein